MQQKNTRPGENSGDKQKLLVKVYIYTNFMEITISIHK